MNAAAATAAISLYDKFAQNTVFKGNIFLVQLNNQQDARD
jgi:hypothetical protein